VARLFYFGESVLLPEYRGRGIGHAFFDHREAQALKCGASAACFAAVIRPDDHPAKPAGYVPHDAFWTKRGYGVVPGLVTELAWKEHGEEGESLKTMQYWLRSWCMTRYTIAAAQYPIEQLADWDAYVAKLTRWVAEAAAAGAALAVVSRIWRDGIGEP